MGTRENSFMGKQVLEKNSAACTGRVTPKAHIFTKTKTALATLTIASSVIALAFGLTACGDDAPLQSKVGSLPINGALHNYFPVGQGYQVTFSVQDAQGQELRVEQYTVTGEAFVNGLRGVSWSVYDQTNSSDLFQGSIFWDQNAIYHQRDGSSRTEVLLQTPLDSAANWDRWLTIQTGTPLDTSSSGGDSDDPSDPDGGLGVDTNGDPDDDPSNSSFPTEGSSKFYIADLHSDITSGGLAFSDCLEIVNVGNMQTINRYWYAPGTGLVKYALNCQFGSDVGTENGQLLVN